MLTESHDEEQIIARVAALDIGKTEVVCCVRVPGGAEAKKRLQEVTTHSTMTRALTELANHLVDLGIERVVMEATSDYWKPVFYLLEFEFGEGGHDGCHGAPCWGAGVDAFAQGAQRNSVLTEIGDGAGDFGDGAAQPIDGGHHHGVAGPSVVQHCRQPGTRDFGRPGEGVGKHALRIDARGAQCRELCVEVLSGGADPCVAECCRHVGTVSRAADIGDLRHAL